MVQREWCKAPVVLLRDPNYYKLSPAFQGVFWNLLLFSLRESDIPGMFLDEAGERLTAEQIAFRAAHDPAEFKFIQEAIPELRRAGLLTFSQEQGFEVSRYID